jgi:hypothetical protein
MNVLEVQKIIGSNWWITVQILYLMGKYSDKNCIFLPISVDPVDEKTYQQLSTMGAVSSLSWVCEKKGCRFDTPATMSTQDFMSYLSECIESSEGLSVIPLRLVAPDTSHANIVIYNKNKNTLERFEPHGKDSENVFNGPLLDKALPRLFEKILGKSVFYIPPSDFCPVDGPQVLEEIARDKLGIRFDKGRGLCSVWSFIYANIRLKYPDKTQSEAMEYIISHMKDKNTVYHYAESVVTAIWGLSERIRNAKTHDDIKNIVVESVNQLDI